MPFTECALITMLLVATPLAQATPKPDAAEIPPIVWEMVSFTEGDAAPVAVTEPERYTVQFLPEGELAFGADCNSGGATYTAADGIVQISPGRMTLMVCPPDSQAGPFLILLQSATTFAFDEEGPLILTGPEGKLTLRPTLSAVVWVWREFRGGDDSVVAPVHPENYTVAFLEDDKLAIRADCNRATGTYSIDGSSLELTVGGMTRAMCPPDSLSDRFVRDLGDVRSHVFRDGNLYLALMADAGIMEFTAQVPESPKATPAAG